MIALLACAGDDGPRPGETPVSAYTMLEEGHSWTYRDDSLGPEAESPDETLLLHARYVGDGTVEFRRGTRWADATDEGKLVWSEEEGLALVEWDLGSVSGSGKVAMSDEVPEGGAVVDSAKHSCTTNTGSPVDTYYGSFELALVFTCTGGEMAGAYAFAYSWGLVQVESEGITLDLVGPW